MIILATKTQDEILRSITDLQILVNRNYTSPDDMPFLNEATEALINITYLVAGTNGLDKVSRNVSNWNKEYR